MFIVLCAALKYRLSEAISAWPRGVLPVDDIKIRSKVKIQDCHSILMMVAVGYAVKKLNVCRSTRRPLNELYTILDK